MNFTIHKAISKASMGVHMEHLHSYIVTYKEKKNFPIERAGDNTLLLICLCFLVNTCHFFIDFAKPTIQWNINKFMFDIFSLINFFLFVLTIIRT